MFRNFRHLVSRCSDLRSNVSYIKRNTKKNADSCGFYVMIIHYFLQQQSPGAPVKASNPFVLQTLIWRQNRARPYEMILIFEVLTEAGAWRSQEASLFWQAAEQSQKPQYSYLANTRYRHT